jgi:GTP:adenosylcobinamide-phosphate guanylyltransferase
MGVPAIITAGDRRAAKAVYGESKVYLEVDGLPLVSRVVTVLQQVPEVTEVWVIGNAERLESVLSHPEVQAALTKPLHVIEQHRNLFENCWESYRRALPGAPPEGRDPVGDDVDFPVLYLSGDLPFTTPQEISEFVRRARETDCGYAVGLVPREALVDFLPAEPGGAGIEVAYFNMREGRLRQSNLHLAKPGSMGARELIEEMYEHRHQKSFWNMTAIGVKLIANHGAGPRAAFWYSLIHLSGLLDRWGFEGLANWVRRANALARTERILGRLLQTDFRFVITEVGGSAVDVDTEAEYDVVQERFSEWSAAQQARAKVLYGSPSAESAEESGSAAEEGR